MDPTERSRMLTQLQRRLQAAQQPSLQSLVAAHDPRQFDQAHRIGMHDDLVMLGFVFIRH